MHSQAKHGRWKKNEETQRRQPQSAAVLQSQFQSDRIDDYAVVCEYALSRACHARKQILFSSLEMNEIK